MELPFLPLAHSPTKELKHGPRNRKNKINCAGWIWRTGFDQVRNGKSRLLRLTAFFMDLLLLQIYLRNQRKNFNYLHFEIVFIQRLILLFQIPMLKSLKFVHINLSLTGSCVSGTENFLTPDGIKQSYFHQRHKKQKYLPGYTQHITLKALTWSKEWASFRGISFILLLSFS